MISASSMYKARHSKLMLYNNPEGWGGEGDGRGSGWGDSGILMADSCQCKKKPQQYCKVINIQLKN